jgi:putative hydrolase of the HAD superfamily
MASVAAIGFDLGETLLTYAGTPPSWATLYPAALARVAEACRVAPDAEDVLRAGEILAHHNTRLRPRREEVRAELIFREILAAWRLAPKDLLEPAIAAYFDFFQQRLAPYPETTAVLAALRRARIRTGILTDVPYGMPRNFVQRDLDGAPISPLVDSVLTSVEVGWRKPESAGFHALADRLEVSPRDLWYVGNEEKDITGALAVGATAILIDRADRHPNWGQHRTIRDLRALLSPADRDV